MKKYIQFIDTVEENYCGGFRWKKDCPNDGIYQENNDACRECYNDAMSAMKEMSDLYRL